MEYLYHYTTVDTLALILRNKTIRLNNLADMDDLEEGSTEDVGKYGRYIYTSSWCKSKAESIPLWALYTQNMQGVRIGMRKNIFDTEVLEVNGNDIKENIQYTKGLLSLENQIPITFMPTEVELIEVEYTDDERLIYPKVVEITSKNSGNNVSLNINHENIGKYKRSTWEFQNEWRYRVKSLPFSKKQLLELQKQSIKIQEKDLSLGVNWLAERILDENIKTQKYIDLVISGEAFENMEILCGPKMTAGQKLIVSDLVEKYNSTAKVRNSELKIK